MGDHLMKACLLAPRSSTRSCGDFGRVTCFVDLWKKQQFMRLSIHCGWQSLNVFTHLCGRNGLSNFGRGRACGTMDLLICFTAFSSSIFRHWLPSVHQQKQVRRMNQPGEQERCVPFVRIHSPLSAFCKSFLSLLSAHRTKIQVNFFTSEELFHRCQKEIAIPCSRK